MTFRRRVERASRGRAGPAIALVWWAVAFVLLAASPVAQAEPVAAKIEEADTEHMFGFTEGSEIGEKGETEFMSETTGHFGKFGASYSQIASMIEAKYTLTDRFRVSGAATLAYYDVSGVPGMDDRRQASVQSISFSARYRFITSRRPSRLRSVQSPGGALSMNGAAHLPMKSVRFSLRSQIVN